MPTFKAELRRNVAESNPDYTTVTVEAEDEAAARKEIHNMTRRVGFHPGWFSRNEGKELWEKASGIEIISVEPA